MACVACGINTTWDKNDDGLVNIFHITNSSRLHIMLFSVDYEIYK